MGKILLAILVIKAAIWYIVFDGVAKIAEYKAGYYDSLAQLIGG